MGVCIGATWLSFASNEQAGSLQHGMMIYIFGVQKLPGGRRYCLFFFFVGVGGAER